jgi:hypothetical protein
MTTFNFKTDMDDIFLKSGFEESITYTPSGESAKIVKAIILRNPVERMQGYSSTKHRYDYEVEVSKTDIINPKLNEDTFTIDSRIFRMTGITSEDQGMYRFSLS